MVTVGGKVEAVVEVERSSGAVGSSLSVPKLQEHLY
jgi:hypothetical protein